MKRTIAKLIAVLCAISLFFSCMISTFAVDQNTGEYAETRNLIYFDNIDVAIADHTTMILSVSPNATLLQRIRAQSDIEYFNLFLEKYPVTKAAISQQAQEGELCAVSYTEAPLTYVDNHYERLSASAVESQTGQTQVKGYFSMTTSIMRAGSPNSAGEYTYTAFTTGEWSKNSALSGENYPASGDDFVVQTLPEGMVLSTHDMLTEYNDEEFGVPGTNSYPCGGGTRYIEYAIQDDPLGLKQLKAFILSAQYLGPQKNYTRQVKSVYTHTWATLTISVSINANIDTSLTPSAGITITPSIANKSWNLFSNVVFNF